MRADLFLVERGHAASRAQAQRLIAAGVRWREADGPWRRVTKNGDELPPQAELELVDAAEVRFLSRGGLKLEGALRASGLSVDGLYCLDLGQSTGGFTDCLLQRGAAQVVGIDVGRGQLHARLRSDTRVVCIEGVNARSLSSAEFWAHHDRVCGLAGGRPHQAFDLLVGDVSFISLTLVLPAMVELLKPGGQALMLVKPQFELQPGQVGKGGIVKDESLYLEVEVRLRDCCEQLGLEVRAWLDSPIEGGDGNREFFVHALKVGDARIREPEGALQSRTADRRQPRKPRRRLDLQEQEAAHEGQPGPARRKRKL